MARSAEEVELRRQIHAALWDKHFLDDTISGVTRDECWLLTDQVWEALSRAGKVRS